MEDVSAFAGLEDILGPAPPVPPAHDLDAAYKRACELAATLDPRDREFQRVMATEFPSVRYFPIIDRLKAEGFWKPAAKRADASPGPEPLAGPRRRGRPADPKNADKRRHRREPTEQAHRDAYVGALRAVYLALEAEQAAGKFGAPRADGRDLPPVTLGKAILKRATGPKSMVFGAAFASMPMLARDCNFGLRMTEYHAKALFAAAPSCFVKHRRRHTSSLIYPALDGIPVHPRAPGYDKAKIAVAASRYGVTIAD